MGIRLLTVLPQQVVGEGRLTGHFQAVLAALVAAHLMINLPVLEQRVKEIMVARPPQVLVSPLEAAAGLLRRDKALLLMSGLPAVTGALVFRRTILEVVLTIAAAVAAVADITATPATLPGVQVVLELVAMVEPVGKIQPQLLVVVQQQIEAVEAVEQAAPQGLLTKLLEMVEPVVLAS